MVIQLGRGAQFVGKRGLVRAQVEAEIAAAVPHVHIFDAFDRADTLAGNLDAAPTGRPWLLTGDGAGTAKITSGRYVSGTPGTSQNVYAYQTLPAGMTVRSMRAGVLWDALTNPQTAVLASSQFPETGFTANLIHLLIGPTSITLQKFVDAVATNVETVTMALAAATVHEFAWTLVGDVVTVSYPGGSFAAADDDFLIIPGRTAYAQIFDTATSTDAARYEWIEAFASAA